MTVPPETVVNVTDPVQEAAVPLDALAARLMRFTSIPSEFATPTKGNEKLEVIVVGDGAGIAVCANIGPARMAPNRRYLIDI